MPGPGEEPLLRLTPEEREEVRAALRRGDLSPRVRERLEMVKAADLGRDLGEIAAWSGRRPRTVRRWLGAFAGGGIEALADAPRSGRPVVADAAYLSALEEAVQTSPRGLGLGFDVWTSGRLSAYLARTRGGRIAPGWVRILLGGMRFACGRPKHTLGHLRDPEEVAACEAELAEAEKKQPGSPGATRCTTRTRRTWRPTLTCAGSGTGWASSLPSRRPGPTGG